MNGFPAKFMLVIAALVLLLMGEFQAICAFLRHAEADQGIVKSTLSHVDCTRDGLRKINTGRKEASFGSCQTHIFSKKIVPIRRNLRQPLTGPKPPSPTHNFPPHYRRPDWPSPPPPSFNDTYSPESKKMNGFPAKFTVLAAAVLFVLGDFAATSALIPVGGKQSTSAFVSDSKDGSRYTFSRRDGCFGCQSMNINKGRQVLLRLRRLQQTRRFTRPPPPPIRSSFGICSAPSAPPPPLTA